MWNVQKQMSLRDLKNVPGYEQLHIRCVLAPQTIRTLKKTRKPTIVSIKPSLKLDSLCAHKFNFQNNQQNTMQARDSKNKMNNQILGREI